MSLQRTFFLTGFLVLFVLGGIYVYVRIRPRKPVAETVRSEHAKQTRTELEESSSLPLQNRTVSLFFLSKNGPWLVEERRELHFGGEEDLARQILLALLDGPESSAHLRTLPSGTELLDVLLDDKRHWIYVNFGGGIKHPSLSGSETEIMAIYSVVNSLLTNLPAYEKVWFLVDGRTQETLWGHIYTRIPFPKNMKWVHERNELELEGRHHEADHRTGGWTRPG